MLRKLLKHELHATGRYMWIVYLAVVLLSVGGFLMTRYLGMHMTQLEQGTNEAILVIFVLGMVVWFIALGAAVVLTIAMNVHRFYKNLLSDEGYLMFTLPVSVHQLTISKLLVAMLWQVLSMALAVGGFVLGIYNLVSMEVGYIFADVFSGLEMNYGIAAAELILVALLGCAASILQIYCAMALGFGFTKNKALWSVVLYFGIQIGLQIISGIFSVASIFSVNMEMMMDTTMTSMQTWHLSMLGGAAVQVVLCAVFYAVTTLNLKKRLNLS